MCSLLCDSDHVEGVRKYATLLSEFLSKFSWLTDSYVLDYFVDKQWQKLPPSWQNALHDVQPEQVSLWLRTGRPVGNATVWPLSLLCLAPAATLLSLGRQAVGSPAHIPVFSTDDACWGPSSDREWPPFDPSNNRNMTHAFRKHVKSKKQHEITRLAVVVELLARKCGCRHVMDVGSGQGHLARLLALDRNLGVATVDLVGSHLSSAKRFDDQAVSHFKKKSVETAEGCDAKSKGESQKPPQHVELEVSMATTPDQLEEVANRAWNEPGPHVNKFVLVGLHTCGDLGSSIVRLFTQTPAVQGLVSVGCCYMKLSCDGTRNRGKGVGYPMSQHVLSLGESARLSYQAREVACHALEVYLSRLREDPSLLKIHCYRALLETVIVRNYADLKHSGLGSVKHAAAMTFAEYARKALRKFPLPISEENLNAPELESLLKEWKRVVLFYSLRLLLAPVVESLVLTDRALYLSEHGISSCLVPLFDPNLSPRNIVLLAFKGGS